MADKVSSSASGAAVDSRSTAFQLQMEDMRLPHDLLGGTKAMIAAGQLYIPKEPGEDAESGNIRVKRTALLNVYRRTLRYMGGRVCEKPVSLGDDGDARFQAFSEDVDKQGHNLTVWSRGVFEHGLNDGVTFCLVDYDNIVIRNVDGRPEYRRADGTWEAKTEAADRNNGWRPYFVHVPAEYVLDGRVRFAGGKAVVSHFRYMETLEEPDGMWGSRR